MFQMLKPQTNPVNPMPNTLSRRGGALVLRSISLFLAGGRSAKLSLSQNNPKPCKGKAKMAEKDNKNKISQKILDAAKRDTHFSRTEIEALYKIYRKLITMNKLKGNADKGPGNASSVIGKPTTVQEGIDRTVFREILHNTFDIVTEEVLMDRIFCAWDKANAGLLTVEAWFWGLSIFLKGTLTEKIEFCFSVYDMNSDGYITKDEMFQLLKNSLIKHPQEEDPDEGVKDLVEIIMKKLDKDKDGKISLNDYKGTVEEEPLLLEAFGRCLPADRARDTFLSTMKT